MQIQTAVFKNRKPYTETPSLLKVLSTIRSISLWLPAGFRVPDRGSVNPPPLGGPEFKQ